MHRSVYEEAPNTVDGIMVKESTCPAGDARDVGSITGSGGFPREGNGDPFKYSRLKNSMDRGAAGL